MTDICVREGYESVPPTQVPHGVLFSPTLAVTRVVTTGTTAPPARARTAWLLSSGNNDQPHLDQLLLTLYFIEPFRRALMLAKLNGNRDYYKLKFTSLLIFLIYE